jgi:hypothetical protein
VLLVHQGVAFDASDDEPRILQIVESVTKGVFGGSTNRQLTCVCKSRDGYGLPNQLGELNEHAVTVQLPRSHGQYRHLRSAEPVLRFLSNMVQ